MRVTVTNPFAKAAIYLAATLLILLFMAAMWGLATAVVWFVWTTLTG